ncbi:SH3 domain-containing protein [Variovorax sp. dw_954]|uniref:SH3 domain-containing protein n=1 Tax=Variovorax sp. dw_954 TaxID=2720078 RepID=UPI001BD542C6|nr:SH3 domain-containing protein [Variovorax sp. dw_954]
MSNTFGMRWIGIGALALMLPLVASAQEAYTRGSVNLRAGPSNDYPLITRLAPGQAVSVVGCTGGYGWCDVVLPDGLRGWAAATRLAYPYGGATVPLASYGAIIGVPIVTFSIGNYWGNYYRDRPWYGEPRWWGGRPPPPPVPGWRPPPPPHAGWQPRPPGPGYVPPPRPPGGPGYGHPGYYDPRPRYDAHPGYAPHPGHAAQPGFNPGRPPQAPGGPPPRAGGVPGQPGQYTEPMKDFAPGVPANKF